MENLSMIRGDTLAFGFELEGVSAINGAYFSVKKNQFDTAYVVQKSFADGIEQIEAGKYSVRVAPNDTYNLEVGTYYYDLQIEVNGDVFTILYGTLEIEADITRDVVEVPPIREGSYYLQLEEDDNTVWEVISFALESDDVVMVKFTSADTSESFHGTYVRTGNEITVTIRNVEYELEIIGSTLYYEGNPLIYKPNFDVDYINSVFEED